MSFRAPSPRQVFQQPQGPASFALWCGGGRSFRVEVSRAKDSRDPEGYRWATNHVRT